MIQLTHAGRFSKIALRDFGTVYGLSRMELKSPVEHIVLPMTKRKIQQVITSYADATSRAIQAGVDGGEISSAQRLLIPTFFSTFSNEREDDYGTQSLENRSAFGLGVLEEVRQELRKLYK